MSNRNPSQDSTPVKGQADTNEGLALDILAKRLQQMELNERLEATRAEELRTEQNQAILQMRQEMLEQKEQTTQALGMIVDKLEKLMDQRQAGPETVAEWQAQASQQAAYQSKVKRQKFGEVLQAAPVGQIISYEQLPVVMQINGHKVQIDPGVNVNIPQPFIEQWEKYQHDKAEGQKFIRAMEHTHEYSEMDRLRQLGSYGDKSFQSWDDTTGVL
jgi:multidrug efflux pump subunit AcrA (membrane-fusion protein)